MRSTDWRLSGAVFAAADGTRCMCRHCDSQGLHPQDRSCLHWRECNPEGGWHGVLCECVDEDGMPLAEGFPIQCPDCGEAGRVDGACEAQEFMGGHGPGMC